LHPELIPINAEFPELIQSKPRKRRVDYLLEQLGPRPNVDDFKTVLSDHDDYPMSICRHSNDDPETGFWQTVFSVIIETDARRLHVSRGTPCDHAYETYIL
jgi:isopenicillin-N N-acyltransferase-like protein